MNYLVTFDIPIENTRIRNKLGEKCMDYGLFRIQFSVFWGSLEKSELEDLMFECEEIIDNSPADVRFFAICEQCLEKSFVIANNAKIQTIHARRISENVNLSTLTHIDVGWNQNSENSENESKPLQTETSQPPAAKTAPTTQSTPIKAEPSSAQILTTGKQNQSKRNKKVEDVFDLSDKKTWQEFQSEYLQPSEIDVKLIDEHIKEAERERRGKRKRDITEENKEKDLTVEKIEKVEKDKEEKKGPDSKCELKHNLHGKILNLKEDMSDNKNLVSHLSPEIIKFLKSGDKSEKESNIEDLPAFDRDFIEKLIEQSQSQDNLRKDENFKPISNEKLSHEQNNQMYEKFDQIYEVHEEPGKIIPGKGESFVSLNDIIKHMTLLEKKSKIKAKYHGFIDIDVILV
ncbi:MAG: CRISPR-associated endonuclease Cas2 [Promethearchaeota archaeon]